MCSSSCSRHVARDNAIQARLLCSCTLDGACGQLWQVARLANNLPRLLSCRRWKLRWRLPNRGPAVRGSQSSALYSVARHFWTTRTRSWNGLVRWAHGCPPSVGMSEWCCNDMQDVKTRTALCLAHLLRVSTPRTPFSNEQLKVELVSVLCCALLPDALPLLRLAHPCCLTGCRAFTVPASGSARHC